MGTLDTFTVDLWFSRYPDLERIICAGTLSLKDVREIIGVDRYEMKDIYRDLLVAGAVYGSGSGQFRASKELREYVAERRKKDDDFNAAQTEGT